MTISVTTSVKNNTDFDLNMFKSVEILFNKLSEFIQYIISKFDEFLFTQAYKTLPFFPPPEKPCTTFQKLFNS